MVDVFVISIELEKAQKHYTHNWSVCCFSSNNKVSIFQFVHLSPLSLAFIKLLRFNSFWKRKRIQDWIKVLSKYFARRNQNFPFDQFQLLNCSRRSRKHLMNWQHFLELHSHHHIECWSNLGYGRRTKKTCLQPWKRDGLAHCILPLVKFEGGQKYPEE